MQTTLLGRTGASSRTDGSGCRAPVKANGAERVPVDAGDDELGGVAAGRALDDAEGHLPVDGEAADAHAGASRDGGGERSERLVRRPGRPSGVRVARGS